MAFRMRTSFIHCRRLASFPYRLTIVRRDGVTGMATYLLTEPKSMAFIDQMSGDGLMMYFWLVDDVFAALHE